MGEQEEMGKERLSENCREEFAGKENGKEKKSGTSCCKKTDRSETDKRKLMNRLSRIEGQIRGIKGMLEKDAYCIDILTQSAAVTAAMNAFNKELLANHMHSCVVRDIQEGKEEVVDELIHTLHKLMR